MGGTQQGEGFRGRATRTIRVFDAMAAARRAQMLAEQLSRRGIEQSDVELVPLHRHPVSNPAWRCAVVGGVEFDAAIEMDGPHLGRHTHPRHDEASARFGCDSLRRP